MLCWLLPVKSFAQQEDITGMWYGQITIIDTQTVSLPYEIAVSEEKGKLISFSVPVGEERVVILKSNRSGGFENEYCFKYSEKFEVKETSSKGQGEGN